MKKVLLITFSLIIMATVISFHTTKVQAASWLEQELDGNEPFIVATEKALSKNREDITLADLETIKKLPTITGAATIPDKISDYKNLTELKVNRGTITKVPDSVGQLKNLVVLNVNQNNLQEFPMVVFQLPALVELDINKGDITEIPAEITDLSSHLTRLDIRFQKLVSLPNNIFTTNWGNISTHKLIISTTGNQITSDVPANYFDDFNAGGNLLEFYDNPPTSYYQQQDQLIYKGNRIVIPLNTNFNQLTPDKTELGLQSGKALFTNHTFTYYDDGNSNNVLTNGVATHKGNGYITIKSSNSTNSNPFAKVRVPITVTDPVAGQDVTVQYVDEEGNELAPADTITGVVGDAYNTTAKIIDGWNLKEPPANAIGTFSDTAQTVTYVYEKAVVAGQDVTVQYVDAAGNELATSDTLSGNVGDAYNSTAKDIEGWKLKIAPSNATGIFSDTAQTVTYVYEKAAVAGQDVTVQYVDEAGNELATSDTLSGNIGDAYTSTAKTMDGWNLKEPPANATGTFSNTAQTVTYVYEKEEVASQDVTVRYVDGAGNELAVSDILSGNIGDAYASTAKDIDGWNLKIIPTNATGTFNDTAQTVTYVYEKNTDDIIPLPLPEEPTTPSDDKTTDSMLSVTPTGKISIQPVEPKEPTKQAKEKSSLPKTGDSIQNSGVLAGLALLLFGIALFMRHSTRKNKK
ncbi:MucBP domain-containing protein [Listeria seeligeri]|uniref:MucBP domain-containing protein n=3 Tax=Listeria seeligeri TaxID=1640 RepID=UPI002893071A|nr:MucBP domain-containing protein [Listeria seeligeri]